MPNAQSVTQWIACLKNGDELAVQRLWERYAVRLVELARQRMKDAPKRIADEEDVAASVFHSLCRGAAAGRFENVKNRDDLWWLLLAITRQKSVDHVRRETAQKRGGGRIQPESAVKAKSDDSRGFALDRLVGEEPTPEFVVMLAEEHERLLGVLRDDQLRQIAVCRIEGFTVPEIAEDLQVSTRSIERKLQLIRGAWSKELET
ncbi:ECF-type sigma factor [Aeoliella sp.]|uniref:ECF-type sigma factor n=1 Tax=Aeoliella sp. TaxID=2795800 RepID=UPI003CCBCE76